jgi:hypothetical protein
MEMGDKMVSFTPQPPYHLGKNLRYPLGRRGYMDAIKKREMSNFTEKITLFLWSTSPYLTIQGEVFRLP